MSDIPEPWASAMISSGITDPRNGEKPSWREMSRRTGVSVTTLTKMAAGSRDTSQATVDAVADQLGLSRILVSSWCGRRRPTNGDFTWPDDARLLEVDEHEALSKLIVMLTRERKGASDVRTTDAEKMPESGSDPAEAAFAEPKTESEPESPATVTEIGRRRGRIPKLQDDAARKKGDSK